MKNKFKIATLLFFTTSFTLGACSDWTDIEGIDIKQPNIQEDRKSTRLNSSHAR